MEIPTLDGKVKIKIPAGGRFDDNNLFNKKEIEQLKLSLYRETRNDEEIARDRFYDVYAFIGYNDFVEKEVNGDILHKKMLGIENLVRLNKYDAASLSQVGPMKMRAQVQYQGEQGSGVYGVYIPKTMWDKDYAYNDDIPNEIKEYIDKETDGIKLVWA